MKSDIQLLESRIRDGKGKIIDQEKRVNEAENALEVMEKSRPGKETFEKADSGLKTLREQEKQRRGVEKDINELEKESAKLKQKIEHEKQEVEKTEKQYASDEKRLKKERKDLAADNSLEKTAAGFEERS